MDENEELNLSDGEEIILKIKPMHQNTGIFTCLIFIFTGMILSVFLIKIIFPVPEFQPFLYHLVVGILSTLMLITSMVLVGVLKGSKRAWGQGIPKTPHGHLQD